MSERCDQVRRLLGNLYTGHQQLHERQQLRNRPWEADLLHFASDGQLHGHLLPPNNNRQYGVTSDGWCLCRRLQVSD